MLIFKGKFKNATLSATLSESMQMCSSDQMRAAVTVPGLISGGNIRYMGGFNTGSDSRALISVEV